MFLNGRSGDGCQAYDINGTGSGVPLEIYFGPKSERRYVATAKPELLKTIKTAAGAHYVGFTKDWKFGFRSPFSTAWMVQTHRKTFLSAVGS